MEVKVVCSCGQKYKFDVEPVGGRMPISVACPVCGVDGTPTANAFIAQHTTVQQGVVITAIPNTAPMIAVGVPPVPAAPVRVAVSATAVPHSPPPVPVAAPPPGSGLRINRAAPTPPPVTPSAPAPSQSDYPVPPPVGAARPFAVAAAQKPPRKTSFGMGLLGGFIGALVGSAIYFLVFKFTGFQFKLLAIGVGGLAGWLAEVMGKGEGSKELGGITAVLVLSGVIGAQYFVALSWWNEGTKAVLAEAQSAYTNAVAEAKQTVTAVPTGSDSEIRAYLVKVSADEGDKVKPGDITAEEIKDFRENQLPEAQKLASGQMTKEQYDQTHEIKATQTKEEQDEEAGTFKAIFLLLLISKINLLSLAAAAGLAFKLSTNA